jgi:hypothetical protein
MADSREIRRRNPGSTVGRAHGQAFPVERPEWSWTVRHRHSHAPDRETHCHFPATVLRFSSRRLLQPRRFSVGPGQLFRVRNDVTNDVGIADNIKIKTPIAIHARLPTVFGFVIFLSVQWGMVKIVFKVENLFENALRTPAGASSRAFSALGR